MLCLCQWPQNTVQQRGTVVSVGLRVVARLWGISELQRGHGRSEMRVLIATATKVGTPRQHTAR